jgi:hypothetical protein
VYYYIESEVAGGLGGGTVLDASVHPPVVDSLEFQFGSLARGALAFVEVFMITRENWLTS